MSDANAIIIGATISSGVAILAVGVQHGLERRRLRLGEAAIRIAEFTSLSHALILRLGGLARLEIGAKEYPASFWDLGDRFNTVLASVKLLDKEAIVVCAHRIDRELVRIEHLAKSRVYSDEEWRSERAPLSEMVVELQREARKVLGSPKLSRDVPTL